MRNSPTAASYPQAPEAWLVSEHQKSGLSGSVLGQTFGMCVLQDFEALTPNILCRTIETVEGGAHGTVTTEASTELVFAPGGGTALTFK